MEFLSGEAHSSEAGGEKKNMLAEGKEVVLTEEGKKRKPELVDKKLEVVQSSFHDGSYMYIVKDQEGKEYSMTDFDIEAAVEGEVGPETEE